jgi:serine/threonine protein kinase
LFWEQFTKLVNGVRKIHTPDWVAKDVLGWHHDIKPENILVISTGPGCYDCIFKIADLGSCRFKRSGLTQDTAFDTDATGKTRAYGAPEAYQRPYDISNWDPRMRQDCDIWSLGGVFSETAVWVVKGMDAVDSYRKRRKDATNQIRNFEDTGAFHDGEEVLPEVASTHRDVQESIRKNDRWTESIFKVVELYMLSNDRLDAIYLERRLHEIVDSSSDKVSERSVMSLSARPPPLRSNVRPEMQLDQNGEPSRPAPAPAPAPAPSTPAELLSQTARLQNQTVDPPFLTLSDAKDCIKRWDRRYRRSFKIRRRHTVSGDRRDYFPHAEWFPKIQGREIVSN